MSDWKKVEMGEVWDYKSGKAGDEFVGLYTGKEENIGDNKSNMYHFEVKGDTMSVWGCTVLDKRFVNLKPGEEVKIVYLGQEANKKKGAKPYHNFEVYHRAAEMEAVE